MNNDNAMMVFIGTLVTVIGAFLPLATFMTMDVSYYDLGGAEKYVFLLAVLAAPTLMFMGKDKLVIFTTLVAWLALLFPIIKGLIDTNDSGLLDKIAAEADSAVADMAGKILMDVTSYNWGGWVFLVGLIVFTVGSIRVWRA